MENTGCEPYSKNRMDICHAVNYMYKARKFLPLVALFTGLAIVLDQKATDHESFSNHQK